MPASSWQAWVWERGQYERVGVKENLNLSLLNSNRSRARNFFNVRVAILKGFVQGYLDFFFSVYWVCAMCYTGWKRQSPRPTLFNHLPEPTSPCGGLVFRGNQLAMYSQKSQSTLLSEVPTWCTNLPGSCQSQISHSASGFELLVDRSNHVRRTSSSAPHLSFAP